MKRSIRNIILLMIVIATALICLTFSASALKSGDFYYVIKDDYTAEISGLSNSQTTAVEIPEEIDGYTVTSIGEEAFEGKTKIIKITIPGSVTEIKSSAFSDCSSLSEVVLSSGLKTLEAVVFYNCTSLKDITIPDSVTSIGTYAFGDCRSLKDVTIPDSVTEIGEYAFTSCTSLENITLSDRITEINYYTFGNCTSLKNITIPDSVAVICSGAFKDCTSLENVALPDKGLNISYEAFAGTALYNNTSSWDNGILYIGKHLIRAKSDVSGEYTIRKGTKSIAYEAFYSCKNLTGINLPEGLEIIGIYAFDSCYKLKNIKLPSSLKAIEACSFRYCRALESIIIPEGITKIGSDVFYSCDNLKFVRIPKSITSIDRSAFDSRYTVLFCYKNDVTSEYIKNSNIKYVYIDGTDEESVFSGKLNANISWTLDKRTGLLEINGSGAIPNFQLSSSNAFSDYKYCITKVRLGEGITSIGSSIFADFSLLEDVSLPESLNYILSMAFYNCVSLKNIIIPENVTLLDFGAFFYCSRLESVTISNSVTAFRASVFEGCTSLKSITIPYKITEISSELFEGCTSLESVMIFSKNCTFDYSCGITKSHKIYGFKDSTAEAYANDIGAQFIDIETVHTHNYTEAENNAYCEYKICSCGDEKTVAHTEVIDSAVVATCKNPGLTEGKHCSVCNMVLVVQATVAQKAHTQVNVPAVAPTCTETGLTQGKKCSVCDEIIVAQNTVAATGHRFTSWIKVSDASCKEAGKKIRMCTCGAHEEQEINKTSHRLITLEAKAATCSETGLTQGKKCSVCDEITVKQEIVPMLAHTEVTLQATAPSCSGTGLSEGKMCSVCGKITVKQEIITSTDHAFSAWITISTANCKEPGKEIRVCYCGAHEEKVIAKLPHNEIILEAVSPTCNASGLTEGKKCSVCGEITISQEIVTSNGHTYSDWITVSEANCKNIGKKIRVCFCGASEEIEIPKTAHSEVILDAKASTCSSTGLTEGKKCSVCGEITVKQNTVAKKAHTYKNEITKATLTKSGKIVNKCTICGYINGKATTIASPASFKLTKTSYTYSGKPITPSVTIKDSNGKSLKKDADYTLKYSSGRKVPGKYTVTITFKGNYSGTKKLTFEIKPATPKITKATSAKKGTVNLIWSNISGETGYEIYYSTSKNGTYKKLSSYKADTVKATISKLTSKKTYYFKVRAYKKTADGNVYSAFSAVKALTVK